MTDVSKLKPEAIDVMQSVFDIAESFEKGELTVADMQAVISVSLKSGHDTISICLSMIQCAIELSKMQK